jgi:hypothetical protein
LIAGTTLLYYASKPEADTAFEAALKYEDTTAYREGIDHGVGNPTWSGLSGHLKTIELGIGENRSVALEWSAFVDIVFERCNAIIHIRYESPAPQEDGTIQRLLDYAKKVDDRVSNAICK